MTAEPSRQQMYVRYRRRVLGWGAAALSVVFVVGSVITLPAVESELEDRVETAAVATGADGLTASFSGQDGTLRCADGAEISDDILADLGDMRGVRKLTVDASCGDGSEPAGEADDDTTNTLDAVRSESSEPAAEPADSAPGESDGSADDESDGDSTDDDVAEAAVTETVFGTIGNDSQFSTLTDLINDAGLAGEFGGAGPITLFAPTNDAFQTLGPDTIAALERDPELLSAVLRHHVTDGELTADQLDGGEIEMLDGTAVSLSPGEASIDTVIVSGDATATLTAVDILATNGVVHGVDAVLLPEGFELSNVDTPTTTTTTTTIPEPAEADSGDAAELETELNVFVTANPILFEPGSTDIAEVSQPVIDQIVELATQLTGISIEVQGFTDTDGNPDRNQTLSENRASSVREALVAAGLDAESVTSSGFGGTQTIVDASGAEDKAASRRVEFVVTTV